MAYTVNSYSLEKLSSDVCRLNWATAVEKDDHGLATRADCTYEDDGLDPEQAVFLGDDIEEGHKMFNVVRTDLMTGAKHRLLITYEHSDHVERWCHGKFIMLALPDMDCLCDELQVTHVSIVVTGVVQSVRTRRSVVATENQGDAFTAYTPYDDTTTSLTYKQVGECFYMGVDHDQWR